MNRALEFRVGLLTLLALVLFVWLVSKVEDVQPFKDVYHLWVRFQDVQRLVVGDPVRLNGLPVGKVKFMTLEEGKVKVRLEVEAGYPILRESKFTVGTAGFFGANYIKIAQPVVKDKTPAQYLGKDEEIVGSEDPGIDKLVEEGQAIFARAKVSFEAINKVLGDPDFRGDIKDAARNLKTTTSKANDMIARVDRKIDEVVENIRKLSSNLNGTVEENRATVQRTLADLEKLVGELKGTATDNREEVRKLVKNVSDFADSLNNRGETAKKLRDAIDQLQRLAADYAGQGMIGSEVAASAKNVTAMTADLRTVAERAKEFVTDPKTGQQIEKTFDSVKGLSEQGKGITEELDKYQFDLRTNTLFDLEKENFRNDATAVATYDNKYFALLGQEDIGNAKGINTVQLGTRVFDDFIIRSGSFRDRDGTGIDADLFGGKARVTIEAFRFKDVILRAIGRYRFNDNFNVMVRREDMNRDNPRTLVGVESHF